MWPRNPIQGGISKIDRYYGILRRNELIYIYQNRYQTRLSEKRKKKDIHTITLFIHMYAI